MNEFFTYISAIFAIVLFMRNRTKARIINANGKRIMHLEARAKALDYYIEEANQQLASSLTREASLKYHLDGIRRDLPMAITEAITIGPLDSLLDRLNAVYKRFLHE